MKHKYFFLLFFILFFAYDGLGLKPDNIGRYSGSLYGYFSLFSIVLSLFFSVLIPHNYSLRRTKIGNLYILLVGLLFFIIIQLYFQVMLGYGDFTSLIHLFSFRPIVIGLFLCYLCSKVGIDNIWRYLSIIAVVSSIIILAVVLLGIEGTAIIVLRRVEMLTGDFRVIIPTSTLTAFGYLAYMGDFIQRKRTSSMILSMVCLSACFIQLHRMAIATIIITLFLCIALNQRQKAKNIIISLFIIVIIIVGSDFLLTSVGYSSQSLLNVFIETRANLNSTQGDTSAELRFLMVANAFKYVLQHYGLGVGLIWQDYDVSEYILNAFALAPTLDSGIYNVIIVYGLIGVIVFLWCSITTIKKMLKIRNVTKDLSDHIYANTLIVSLLYSILASLGGDYIVLDYSSIFYITIVLSHVLLVKYE